MQVKQKVWMIILTCFCCSLIFLCGVTCSQQEAKSTSQVVSLLPDEIKPPTATVTRGTTVIWVNEARGMVEIQFINTESMTVACDSPIAFVKNLEGQFVSDKIPFASVASICFIQKGEFNYEIRRETSSVSPGKTKELKGKIIVK